MRESTLAADPSMAKSVAKMPNLTRGSEGPWSHLMPGTGCKLLNEQAQRGAQSGRHWARISHLIFSGSDH